jgi:hypothetical protein
MRISCQVMMAELDGCTMEVMWHDKLVLPITEGHDRRKCLRETFIV